MRFNDERYVNDLLTLGRYPKIHDAIFSLDKFIQVGNVLDIGCCTGLLSHRLACRHNLVVGIEPSESYLSRAVKKSNIVYRHQPISMTEMSNFSALLREFGITAAYMRRVVPEIYDTGGMALVHAMIETFAKNNVRNVVLEGRICSVNSVHRLKNIDLEIECFNGIYRPVQRVGNCALLQL